MGICGWLFLLSVLSFSSAEPVVETNVGTIIGTFHTKTVFGKEFKIERYLGVPYAEPPVGDLRFRKPVPRQPFSSPYRADKHGNVCHQMNILPILAKGLTRSENCLFLNIYTPAGRQRALPVMIWIHGGGFVAGASDSYVSDALAAYGDVIVVTMNYRLSLWGFLSTGDEHAPGNYGLFDQHLAFKWVHENINSFGGDTRRITIFGESAGAASVVYQSIFEGNRGLFQRAIAQSGSVAGNWTSTEDPKPDAEKLGQLLGCLNMESSSLVKCLKDISADSLDAVLNNVSNGFIRFPCPFIPSIDGDFLKKPTAHFTKVDPDMLTDSRPFFGTLDFLTGINSVEGALMMNPLIGIHDPEHLEPNRTYFEDQLLPKALSVTFGNNIPQIIQDLIVNEYTNWEDPENMANIRNNFMQIYADLMFAIPMLETIGYHTLVSKHSKGTYLYQFDVAPSQHFLPTASWVEGANHADEMEYLFFDENAGIMTYMPLIDNYRPEDWESDIAEYMITMWSNFAQTGYNYFTLGLH